MACRLCTSRKTEAFRSGGLDYEECPDCGYIGLSRRSWPDKAAEEERYALHRNDPEESGYRAYLGTFIDRALAPFLAPGSAILDFGSGPRPALSIILEERGYRARPYDPFFAPSTSWRRRTWEGIALHEVAEHLRAPYPSLAALARRLEPGGILAIRTRFSPETHPEFESWWYRRDSTHLGFWKPASFDFLASALGLEVSLVAPPDIAVLRKPTSPE